MKKIGMTAIQLGIFVGASFPVATYAANAAYLIGNSPDSLGTGGTSIAMPQDSFVADDNPAGMAFIGTRIDVYGAALNGKVEASFGPSNNKLSSNQTSIFPGLAGNYVIDDKWTIGYSTQSTGAAADFKKPLADIPGLTNARATFMQVNSLGTITYKPMPNLALGASAVLGLQKFRADGVLGTKPDGAPAVLPNHGSSYAWGSGYALGVLWKPVEFVSVGASYYSKMSFSKLDGYKDDLLAMTGGSIDMPPRYGAGVSFELTDDLTVGFDYLNIRWSESKAFGHDSSFNWHDQHVARIGAIYKFNDQLTARIGYSRVNNFADSEHTLANLFTSGISNRALTAGFSYAINKTDNISASYEYGFYNEIKGSGISEGTNIRTRMQMLMVGFERKF